MHAFPDLFPPDYPPSTPPVVASSPAAGRAETREADRIPAPSHRHPLPVPSVAPPDVHGRFFIIRPIAPSLIGSPLRWRCILMTARQGYISHADFGPTDADYVLAIQYGQQFESLDGHLPADPRRGGSAP